MQVRKNAKLQCSVRQEKYFARGEKIIRGDILNAEHFSQVALFFTGKTFLLQDLIGRLETFVPDATSTKIIYCYGSVPPTLGSQNHSLFKGLPDTQEILSAASNVPHTILVLDDCLERKFLCRQDFLWI